MPSEREIEEIEAILLKHIHVRLTEPRPGCFSAKVEMAEAVAALAALRAQGREDGTRENAIAMMAATLLDIAERSTWSAAHGSRDRYDCVPRAYFEGYDIAATTRAARAREALTATHALQVLPDNFSARFAALPLSTRTEGGDA